MVWQLCCFCCGKRVCSDQEPEVMGSILAPDQKFVSASRQLKEHFFHVLIPQKAKSDSIWEEDNRIRTVASKK
jgi:hypothetical protein